MVSLRTQIVPQSNEAIKVITANTLLELQTNMESQRRTMRRLYRWILFALSCVSIALASYLIHAHHKMAGRLEMQNQQFNQLGAQLDKALVRQYLFREKVVRHFDIPRSGSRGATSQVIDRANK